MGGRHPKEKPATSDLGVEQTMRDLFEASPIGIYRCTLDGRFLQVNGAEARLYGYASPEEMLREVNPVGAARALWETPEERAAFLGKVLSSPGHYHQGEARLRRRDGSLLLAKLDMLLTTDPGTQEPCLVGFVQDLTAFRQTEAALQESRALLETAVSTSPAGILIVDAPDGRIRFMNEATMDMLGLKAWTPGEATLEAYLPPGKLCHPDGRPIPWKELPLTRAVQRGETTRGLEILSHRAGGTHWIVVTASPIRDAQGRITAGLSIVRDITDRKHDEQEIQRLKSYLGNIIDSMPSVLAALDAAGSITQWNRQAEAATGVKVAEALGRPFQDVLPDFAPCVATLREGVVRHGQASAREKVLLERGGERLAYEVMVYPLTDPGVEGVVVRIEDMTERARLQDLLIQAEKLMSIGGLAAGMAHEINNPLGIISQAAQNIARRLSADLPANQKAAEAAGLDLGILQAYLGERRIQPFLDSIQEAVGRATRIVGNLLELSRKPESSRSFASLAQVVEGALDLAARDYDLKKRLDFKNIQIERDLEPNLPPLPMVVPEIEQVLLNLLKNAAQALACNPPDRPRRLRLRLRREPAHVVLDLEDNGPGMPEAVRRRIFEPFFTTRDPGLGTGLGLSVSYLIIVQNHGGSMEVASGEGQGTRFTLRLPLAPGDAHA